MATLQQQPLAGVAQLLALDSVMVVKKSKLLGPNKFEVVAPDDTVVMRAHEEISAIRNLLSDNTRTFNISIRNTLNEEVIRLRRPSPFFVLSKMKVMLYGQLVSVVRQKMTWRRPVLLVTDVAGRPVLKIKGAKVCCSPLRDYQVFSADAHIGEISQKVHREGSKTYLGFDLSFPADLDVRYKCALVGAAILIDYLE